MSIETLIGIVGKICSGKTTIAKKISSQFNFPIVSFGSYLVNFSMQHNLSTDRESLQNLGDKFIKENSALFLKNVLDSSPGRIDKIIIEGIRHQAIFDELKMISKNWVFAFVEAPFEIRYRRCLERQKESHKVMSPEEFRQRDIHVVESEIDSLKNQCQIIIDSVALTDERLFKCFSGIKV